MTKEEARPTEPTALLEQVQHAVDQWFAGAQSGDCMNKIYGIVRAPAQPAAPTPSLLAAEINALPERTRHFVHWLETNADPAGNIRQATVWRENAEALAVRVRELEASEAQLAAVRKLLNDRDISPGRRIMRALALLTASGPGAGDGCLKVPCPICDDARPGQERKVSVCYSNCNCCSEIAQLRADLAMACQGIDTYVSALESTRAELAKSEASVKELERRMHTMKPDLGYDDDQQ